MPSPFLSTLTLVAVLAATVPQGGDEVWRARGEEWLALDPAQAELEQLEAALEELADAGPAQDPAVCAWSAKVALTLYERLRQQGEFARAQRVVELGLTMCPEPGLARTYLWIWAASYASLVSDGPGALAAADEAEAALPPEHESGSLPVFVWCLRAQAMIQMGVPDQAAPWVQRSVERAESLRGGEGFDRGALIEAYTKRANLRMATNSYERMRSEVEVVLADEELLAGNSLARARFLVRLAMAHLWRVRGDDEQAAAARARFAEALAEPGIQAQDRLTSHMRLGQLELLAGNVALAGESLRRARELVDVTAVGGGQVSVADRALMDALEARVERLREDGDDAARATARDSLRAVYDDLLLNWRTRPESRSGVGFLRYPGYQDVVAEIVEGELAAQAGEAGRRAALVQLARAQAVGDLPEALGAREPDWGAIEALVPAGGGLLVGLGAPGVSHVFAVDADGTAHERLPDVRDVQVPRDALERLLGQSPAGLAAGALERRARELAEHAAGLSAFLFPPALGERVSGWASVTLVTDDLVGPSAIELVTLGGEPLCLARPVAFLPGLAVGAALAERASTPAVERPYVRDLTLVADVRHSDAALERFPHLVPLGLGDESLAAWRASFYDARVEDLTGERATLARLAAAPAARVQHFVTHGVRDATRARPAGLALTPGEDDDGLLFAEHVAELPAPALAVLSVCSAGRGPERVGDAGASDLSGAFLAAGADAVLLAPVDLPLEPVVRYVPRLHAELARGATPAEALWRARRELAGDATWSDPFHHLAGLRVLGLGHRPLFRAKPEQVGSDEQPEDEDEPRRFLFGALIAAAFVVPAWLLVRRRSGRA